MGASDVTEHETQGITGQKMKTSTDNKVHESEEVENHWCRAINMK